MKMHINKKWIIGIAALGVAVAVMIARHKTEIAQDSASSEDQRAIQTPRISNESTTDANHQISAENPNVDGFVGRPDATQSDEQGTRFSGKSAQQQAVESGTSHDVKQARLVGPDGIGEEDADASELAGMESPPPGVQLAPEVRLPVAALPIDFETNEVTAKMLELIVTDYYSDLAAGVSEDVEEIQTSRLEENGEITILVKNGPIAEAARQRADWRFRAIFGKEAFNRMSMQSNLEARLPLAE